MKSVVVGVNGSVRSEAAARWAATVAGQAGARLTQIGVTGSNRGVARLSPFPVPVAMSEAAPAASQSLLVGGSPGPTLVAEAVGHDADLVVVGSGQPHGVEGVTHRGVADYLARHLRRPLALVPAGTGSGPVRHLVVGVGGGDGDHAALQRVAALARAIDADVVVAHAFHRPLEFWVHADARSQWAKERRVLTGLWTEPLRAAGVLRDIVMVDCDDPAQVIDDVATSSGADAMVVGDGRSRPFMLAGGASVSSRLRRLHLRCPLVQVPSRVDGDGAPASPAPASEDRTGTAAR